MTEFEVKDYDISTNVWTDLKELIGLCVSHLSIPAN